MVKKYKFMRLDRQTHAALDSLRKKDETYCDVVVKLLTVSEIFDHHQSVQTMMVVNDSRNNA